MICIKSINGFSNGKWALTQTQANRPRKLSLAEKLRKSLILRFWFNNSIVSQSPYQKHLGIFLDVRLNFEEHLKVITTKVNKTIGLLQTLPTLPRPTLMTMYKPFVKPHLDYGDII